MFCVITNIQKIKISVKFPFCIMLNYMIARRILYLACSFIVTTNYMEKNQACQLKFCMHFSLPPCMLHMPHVLPLFIF
jgi:hypothetical protein